MKETFTLSETFDKDLDKKSFAKAKKVYCNSIRENDFSILEDKNLVTLIKTIKRQPDIIGPYIDLTPFEVLNRIGSDLVLLAGAEKLFNNEVPSIIPLTIKLNMGNKAGEDITIRTEDHIIYGEAFNAAPSFCKTKMRQSIDKIFEGFDKGKFTEKQAVVFYNADVESEIRDYKNQKEIKHSDITIHKIACDYEKVVDFNLK